MENSVVEQSKKIELYSDFRIKLIKTWGVLHDQGEDYSV